VAFEMLASLAVALHHRVVMIWGVTQHLRAGLSYAAALRLGGWWLRCTASPGMSSTSAAEAGHFADLRGTPEGVP
jgi:hypothetical protein